MTVKMVVNDYVQQLNELGTALNKLHQMTADIDETSAPLLVRNIREETLEVIGWHVSTLEAAQKALTALERQDDLELAPHFLGSCNRSFLEMFTRFYANLYTAHQIADLEKLEKKKGTGHWAHTIMNDLYACQQAMQKVCTVLLNSWQVTAESLAGRAPSMHSTSIGQQFLISERKQ